MRNELQNIYEVLLPSYGEAWCQAIEVELPNKLKEWDDRYGEYWGSRAPRLEQTTKLPGHPDQKDEPPLLTFARESAGGLKLLYVNWWQFLVSEQCKPPLTSLETNEAFRFLNAYMRPEKLLTLNRSVESFFRERWEESNSCWAVVNFRASRAHALSGTSKALHLLDRLILA